MTTRRLGYCYQGGSAGQLASCVWIQTKKSWDAKSTCMADALRLGRLQSRSKMIPTGYHHESSCIICVYMRDTVKPYQAARGCHTRPRRGRPFFHAATPVSFQERGTEPGSAVRVLLQIAAVANDALHRWWKPGTIGDRFGGLRMQRWGQRSQQLWHSSGSVVTLRKNRTKWPTTCIKCVQFHLGLPVNAPSILVWHRFARSLGTCFLLQKNHFPCRKSLQTYSISKEHG